MSDPTPPQGIPTSNPDGAIRGAYTYLGILVGRLYNLGETSAQITAALRTALDHAKHDGVGQDA